MLTEIYTTYFANLKNLPADVIPISICNKVPEGYKGLVYKKLAPPSALINHWKRKHDESYYIRTYREEVLGVLNPYNILKELEALVPGENAMPKKIALVCYEKSGDFCHRHLVARWFKNINIPVKEFSV